MRILYLDIDTLRPDHLGCYGYHRDTSPNIDALAADGIRFDNVYASDVPCLPSRTALATGTFGTRNGVVTHGGTAADLRPEGPGRQFMSATMRESWAWRFYRAGWHTASLSSFPFRHSASWWNNGFMEALNLMRGMGGERADQVLPGALDWLDRRGRDDQWFLHVHLWDPHTPYNTPDAYGNPFEGQPIPAWHTEEVRQRNWDLPGPHTAQEPWGFTPDEWGPPPPRQPWDLSSMEEVTRVFDGYDVGIRYADDAVGRLVDHLDRLGVLDETAILVSSDHGEAFGELGVYADHQGADEATTHVPAILRWPGLAAGVDRGLHYHLDLAATLLDLAEAGPVPDSWAGRSLAPALTSGGPTGRDHLVLTQGAWTCQRGVRTGDHLYLRTGHDGYHCWPDEMLFDVVADPHETHDLAADRPDLVADARSLLDEWTAEQLDRAGRDIDPLDQVLAEGGPYHARGHLPAYLTRLRETGRGHWADVLAERHPVEADPASWVEFEQGRRALGRDLAALSRAGRR
ncbi:MAG TPA: sulfatase [Acidimicrobiales bacterium]|nr:sulfatase [Acidimicrobiales bacterium]